MSTPRASGRTGATATGGTGGSGARRRHAAVLVGALVAVMWVAEIVDLVLDGRLDGLGIEPRETDGLVGVVLAPFLHAGLGHLAANTVPLAVMGLLVAVSGLARLLAVTAVVTLVSGLGTWLLAPGGTEHIGASGVVFGYAAYLVFRGVFRRRLVYLVTAALVVLVWGSALLGGLLPQQGVSWQGHLFGAVGGVLAARLLTGRRGQRPSASSTSKSSAPSWSRV